MCGISGFIDYQRSSSKPVLREMTDTLQHRGPDAAGYEVFETSETTVGLGHRRLAIIDLSAAGIQPMHHGNLSIVFNGEIYNYQELRVDLSSLGHKFHTGSDTEVILHSFEAWGKECVKRFTGMFSFVIYDRLKNEIFCARDRAGVKPFFYYLSGDLFLFASELKAFSKHPRFKKEIDPDAVAAFMQYGNVPSPYCIFKKCHKLRPGHTLHFDIDTKALKLEEYWNVYDFYNQPKLELTFNEAKAETEKILEKAFRYRMIADVPLGIFLSGGYDSACLTALLQKESTQRIRTFTIGVPDIGLNEAPHAKAVAKHLGTEHTEFTCTQKEAIDLIDALPVYFDEPFGDSSAIPTMLVSRLARSEVTVALSADAGDEIFAGYNRYDYLMRHGRFLAALPKAVRSMTAGIMERLPAGGIPVLKGMYNFSNRYEKLKMLLQDPSPANMMRSLSLQYTEKQLTDLLKIPFRIQDTAYTSDSLKKEFYSPLAYMMAIDYQTYLADDILQKVDRASMSQGLEAREPFLDQHIIEWSARLPDTYKYREGIKKYILREIVHQYVPKEMMERPKMGFAIPLENWLSADLKELVLCYLDDARIASQGIFNPGAVRQMKEDFFSGKKELAVKIWYLLMFQMWWEKWMA